MRRDSRVAFIILGATVALTACGSPKADIATSCLFEVNPPGAYTYPGGVAAPTVTPAEGGTAEGAAAVNACIQRRAAALGAPIATSASAPDGASAASASTPIREYNAVQSGGGMTVRTYTYGTPPAAAAPGAPTTDLAYTPRQRGAAAMTGGAGYRGSYLEGGTGTATYAADVVPTRAAAPKPAKGKLPLPVEYPLLPGDAERWNSLTLAEQQRALLFLKDGSTIGASLRTD
ncbi:hypothetical protein [Defluviimonas salinarum]|uniref:Beta-barrel assembly machine subunit BamC n=1 Tax=Defluviimonas salinarum TaxID=2992147 RepID=A0ABT3J4N9_9RHOB|nr:hypothetical protein [Defluviimonas salinarum]MCW3782641.1 hypothetical protein [Defluviimonas salinarum]